MSKMDNEEFFYFEPQTGIVKRTPIRSNFYVFRLPLSWLAKVEFAVKDAVLGTSGFVYTTDFLAWLDKRDTRWDQKKGLPVPFEYGGQPPDKEYR